MVHGRCTASSGEDRRHYASTWDQEVSHLVSHGFQLSHTRAVGRFYSFLLLSSDAVYDRLASTTG